MDLNSGVDARVVANVVQTDKQTETQIPKVDVTMKKEKKGGVKNKNLHLLYAFTLRIQWKHQYETYFGKICNLFSLGGGRRSNWLPQSFCGHLKCYFVHLNVHKC